MATSTKREGKALAALTCVLSLTAGATAQQTPIYTPDNGPEAPALEALPLKDSVSQYGITWTFEEPARVGQFVNGDWYVVGPVTIEAIDPKPLWGDEVGELIDQQDFGFGGPRENIPTYGQNMAQIVGEASLLLLSDYPPEQKEPLLINFVQAGIDFWGLAREGMSWPAHGGIYSGRKWPILFAGLMLDDEQGRISGARWVRGMWEKYRNDLPPAPPAMDGPTAPPAEETWR
ncbi:MAG: hypothetical protein WD118_08890 [Phycisphaeraceae bacterium]